MGVLNVMRNRVGHKAKFSLVALSLFLWLPLSIQVAYADSSTSTCSPPTFTSGVHVPVGADAALYTYNCKAGLWESAYYSFNPYSDTYAPLYTVVYTYDPTTGEYNYPDWIYDAPNNNYIEITQSTTTPPSGAVIVGAPSLVSPDTTTNTNDNKSGSLSGNPNGSGSSNTISNTGSGSLNTINNQGNSGSSSNINTTGTNSSNSINSSQGGNLNLNNATLATDTNNITSKANSGNASVTANTLAGGATTGNAINDANVVNLLQSAVNVLGPNAVTFVDNINGDVNGNLLLNPSTLASAQVANDPSPNNLVVNSTTGANMTSNIDLASTSGNADVSNNTTAGNATSGNASAIANVVNVIDSALVSGRSFLGVININGDLNGNILLPPDFVNQLLADNVPIVNIISNTGANSSNSINGKSGSTTNITNANNATINNNVAANASSGTASVSGNTAAGNATSGNTTNSITAFNLTGSNLIGSNDLLVFVNVAGGQWVGLIINAPPGTTAAEFGGGVLSNSGDTNANINNQTKDTISNNIDLTAASGNATVSNNTRAGNATSGNADNVANLLNIEDSNLALSNWFGILFINVFGTWNGNLGIYTPDPPLINTGMAQNSASDPSITPNDRLVAFEPTVSGSGAINTNAMPDSATGSVLITGPIGNNISPAAVIYHPSISRTSRLVSKPRTNETSASIVVGSLVFFALYLIWDHFYFKSRRAKKVTKAD